MAKVVRWKKPQLRGNEARGDAEWASVDLFYDLVFAVVIAQLALAYADDITPAGLLTFTLLLVPTIRLWMGQTLYSDRFEAVDVSHRLFVFAGMMAAAGLAVAAPSGLGVGFPLFAASFIVSRALLVAQWLRAGRHEPRARPLALRYLIFFSFEAALWGAAIFAPASLRPWLIATAVLTDLVLPLTTTRIQGEVGGFSEEHLSDRFVDFFLVVLGQLFIIAILIMTRTRQPTRADAVIGLLSLVLAFELWWVYVDHVVGRPLRPGVPWHAAWVYLHIPILVASAAFGAGLVTFVTRGVSVVEPAARLLLCSAFGAAILFAGLAEISLVALREERGRLRRASVIHGVPAAASLALGLFGGFLSAIPLLLVLVAIGLFGVLTGEYFRVEH